jgi:hypothetical protein
MPRKLDAKFNKSIAYYKTILVLTTDQKHPRKTGKVVQNKKRLIVPEFVAKPGKALEDAAKAARGLSFTAVHPSIVHGTDPSVTIRSLVPPSPYHLASFDYPNLQGTLENHS